jgi:hypothetical protein
MTWVLPLQFLLTQSRVTTLCQKATSIRSIDGTIPYRNSLSSIGRLCSRSDARDPPISGWTLNMTAR